MFLSQLSTYRTVYIKRVQQLYVIYKKGYLCNCLQVRYRKHTVFLYTIGKKRSWRKHATHFTDISTPK